MIETAVNPIAGEILSDAPAECIMRMLVAICNRAMLLREVISDRNWKHIGHVKLLN